MSGSSESVAAFAPGRVNLIGEHTDYNAGLALPFAIARGVSVRGSRLGVPRLEVDALDFGERDAFTLAEVARARVELCAHEGPQPSPGAVPRSGPSVTPANGREALPAAAAAVRGQGWRAFVRGTAAELAAELAASGTELGGARLEISSTLPRGGGLSSSAALTIALCLALCALAGAELPAPLALARLGARVERRWVGAHSGLLDELAVLHGRERHALRIDFASLELAAIPLALGDHRLVVLDSGEAHSHGGGEPGAGGSYNTRRSECAQACELLGVRSLREATREAAGALPAPLAARALHVIGENARVEQTIAALRDGELARVGELLDESHESLRDRFEVSTPAVERTRARLKAAGALGARITGGGFGGYVLGLLPAGARPPEGALVVRPSAGARLL